MEKQVEEKKIFENRTNLEKRKVKIVNGKNRETKQKKPKGSDILVLMLLLFKNLKILLRSS